MTLSPETQTVRRRGSFLRPVTAATIGLTSLMAGCSPSSKAEDGPTPNNILGEVVATDPASASIPTEAPQTTSNAIVSDSDSTNGSDTFSFAKSKAFDSYGSLDLGDGIAIPNFPNILPVPRTTDYSFEDNLGQGSTPENVESKWGFGAPYGADRVTEAVKRQVGFYFQVPTDGDVSTLRGIYDGVLARCYTRLGEVDSFDQALADVKTVLASSAADQVAFDRGAESVGSASEEEVDDFLTTPMLVGVDTGSEELEVFTYIVARLEPDFVCRAILAHIDIGPFSQDRAETQAYLVEADKAFLYFLYGTEPRVEMNRQNDPENDF